VVACIQGGNTITKKVRVDASETDIEGAIKWEISQQVLGSLDEFRMDYQEIMHSPPLDNAREFLVVACRSEYVDVLYACSAG